jgi:myosin III
LKLDGWALGKSKVFLKYYHIEFLSKLYEDQIKKIVLVQAFVRRWLAKVIFKRLKKEKELSALTLQKHVRGWLTRRRFQLLREKQIREKIELERQERKNEMNLKNQFMSRSALLKKLSSEEQGFDKENRAAMVIQTCKKKDRSKIEMRMINVFSRFPRIFAEKTKILTGNGGKNQNNS